MGKVVLLTGGAGFIGSHIAEEYCKKGYEVVIVDNLSSGNLNNLENIINKDNVHFHNVDITDFPKLEEVFQKYKPNVINHHAAQKSVSASVENPLYDAKINVIGLINILVLLKIYKVKNFIYVSSGGALSKEIIGDEKSSEIDLPQLESPYAINKYLGEQYLKLYSKLYGFGFTILRYANVYGPRQIADGECGVIPIFINNILKNKDSILMTYDDMPRGCTRDYVYVKDIVQANMIASEKITNEIINIGSGCEVAILDIYDEITRVFNSTQKIFKKGPRLGDVKRSILDNNKAKKILNWQPRTTLIEGLNLLKEVH
ncbi:SDR family NAD(P)-dependent oxidoreductase [Clostridium sp. SHJSY1]|uniref:SDR family NAD(P)-dependent oxidoreductase n=1 Tax=Clostridium sp. SHJSY1 TaxID=2942483 RepID=UPI002875F102|nr:SDR family NAD(P)-dependent oxidoreductase [Clostridium sp. SHJSY1]MDS0526514.1 SDR family NAD(P)-dependent oxidoreductase [Clostridium sp. SHJSY1]